MNPQDIDKIANAVVNSLAGAGAGLLGCGAVSNSFEFFTRDDLECGTFECGGLALFRCCGDYVCHQRFSCAGPARFASTWYSAHFGFCGCGGGDCTSPCPIEFWCHEYDPRGDQMCWPQP